MPGAGDVERAAAACMVDSRLGLVPGRGWSAPGQRRGSTDGTLGKPRNTGGCCGRNYGPWTSWAGRWITAMAPRLPESIRRQALAELQEDEDTLDVLKADAERCQAVLGRRGFRGYRQ